MTPKAVSQKTPTLTIERTFNATPERLWSHWTDPVKYAKWLNPAPGKDLVIHEFDVRPGGRMRFDMPLADGTKNAQEGVFHSLDPPREIVSGSADKSFLLRVTFTPVGKKTRMTVNVTGVPPEYHQAATQGWNAGFDKLAALFEGQGPVDGFTIERMFKAPPEKVWRMWTTKEGLERWFVPDGYTSKVTKLDLRVGGEYAIEMTDKNGTLVNHGKYVALEPNKKISQIWRFDIYLGPGDKPYDVPITVTFEAVPGGTKVRFTQGPLASPEFTEGSRQGVTSNLEKLAKVVEGRK